jgi:hypothetical protein
MSTTATALFRLMAGNADAVQMVQDIAFASHIYDDLIDCDKKTTQEQIHALMWKMLIALPMNPFYRQHEAMFRPLLITGILNWRAANEMEKTGDLEELHISHVTRYAIADVAIMAMALAGGQDHAVANTRELRLLSQQDTWANYHKEHTHA